MSRRGNMFQDLLDFEDILKSRNYKDQLSNDGDDSVEDANALYPIRLKKVQPLLFFRKL